MGKTYLDWLRSLSKEEMAEYLGEHVECTYCPARSGKVCDGCVQNWLKKLSESMPMPKLEVGDVIFTECASYVYLGGETFVTNVIEDFDNCENVTLVHRIGLSGEILSVNRRLADGEKTLTTIWEK